MKSNLLLLLMAFSFFSNFQCGEEEPPCEGENNTAKLDIEVIPNLKEYTIGDTLWLTTFFDTDLELTNNQGSINIDTASGNVLIDILKVVPGQTEVANGFNDFEIVNSDGLLSHLSNDDYTGNITFSCSLDSCGFKVGILPKASGTYCLHLLSGTAYSSSSQMTCGLLNRFRENIFLGEHYNRDILHELGINSWLQIVGTDGSTGYLDVFDDDGFYLFKVN